VGTARMVSWPRDEEAAAVLCPADTAGYCSPLSTEPLTAGTGMLLTLELMFELFEWWRYDVIRILASPSNAALITRGSLARW